MLIPVQNIIQERKGRYAAESEWGCYAIYGLRTEPAQCIALLRALAFPCKVTNFLVDGLSYSLGT